LKQFNLTEAERLQLANQYAILEKLDQENAEDYSKLRKIVEEGYTILYGKVFHNLNEPVSMEESQYVFDVLHMYKALQQSYEALPDKSGIDSKDIRFRGFDGNNEPRQLSLAQYMQKEGHWQESLKGDLDSHSMTQDFYKKRLARWNAIKERHSGYWDGQLTRDEIKEIVS
jgi:uncharacterized protein YfbU (UPF0304 family)